jgi:hypothetical protein
VYFRDAALAARERTKGGKVSHESPILRQLGELNAMLERIPKGQVGLVGVDNFAWPPEMYLVAVYPSREEAQAALGASQGEQAGRSDWISDRYFLLDGEGPAEPQES